MKNIKAKLARRQTEVNMTHTLKTPSVFEGSGVRQFSHHRTASANDESDSKM